MTDVLGGGDFSRRSQSFWISSPPDEVASAVSRIGLITSQCDESRLKIVNTFQQDGSEKWLTGELLWLTRSIIDISEMSLLRDGSTEIASRFMKIGDGGIVITLVML